MSKKNTFTKKQILTAIAYSKLDYDHLIASIPEISIDDVKTYILYLKQRLGLIEEDISQLLSR